jgi:hypothetical protein
MKTYSVSVQVNSWATIEVEAENEEAAQNAAYGKPWGEWELDTDWANFSEAEITEVSA